MDQALDWLIVLAVPDEGSPSSSKPGWPDPAHRRRVRQGPGDLGRAASGAVRAKPGRARETHASRRRPHWKPLATAAVLILGLFSFSNLPMRLQADHLTVVGERQRLQLEDGSKVLLNTNSAFSSSIKDQQRMARLYQGEAFFEVPPTGPTAGNRRRPGAGQRARYRLRRALSGWRGTGASAARRCRSARHRDDARVRLSAGESIRIGPKGFDRPAKLDAATDLAWVQGRLIFENCPLSEVLAELRRYYPGWIINTNEQLANVAVTGNYRLDQPLDVVRSLAHITSAKLRNSRRW
jgi:transmembrane sensor